MGFLAVERGRDIKRTLYRHQESMDISQFLHSTISFILKVYTFIRTVPGLVELKKNVLYGIKTTCAARYTVQTVQEAVHEKKYCAADIFFTIILF